MNIKRMAQVAGTAALAPLLVLAMSPVAHADGFVHWDHKPTNKCLQVHRDWKGNPDDVYVQECSYEPFYDVHLGDGSWLEKDRSKQDYCMTAYTDHDVYMEPCSGNNYQRWDEIDTGAGWKLRNRQTQECLDSNGTSVYMHECNTGNQWQLWV
ncbi:RICIN domain-containing protein [Streptomyces sp. NPDC051555]|uniref:RICIN domain-containing protein n=1 Tax=Streptomyces sp. NPDC051555 TaxID=3365657 RepID=UPI00379FF805